MAYSTYQQLVDNYGAPLLARLVSRRDDASPIAPALIQLRCETALEDAAGFMDSFFQVVQPVPVFTSAPSGLSMLRSCCEQVAVSYLVTRRGYLPRSEDEALVVVLDRWRSFLRSVSKGEATIPGLISAPPSADRTTFVVSEEPFFPDASKFA